MTRLSVYDGVKDTQGVAVLIDAVVERIRTGARGLKEKTEMCNVLAQTDKAAYSELKNTLPAVTWGGVFEKRKAEALREHTGYIVLDVDDTLDTGSVLADFSQNPHVRFAFVSPSGQGIKPVIPVDPIPCDAKEHTQAFFAVLDVFDAYVQRDPKQIKAQKEVNRLCFLAWDPNPVENPNAIPVTWDPSDVSNEQQASDGEGWVGGSRAMPAVDGSEASTVLEFVPRDLPYADWRNVGMAIKAEGLPLSVWQEWCGGERLSSSGGWIQEDLERFWRSFGGTGVTWATVVHLAKQNGYEPPRSSIRRPVKLQKNVVSMLTETLEASRAFLTQAVMNMKHRFFGLRADTGVGKTETMITFFMRGFSGLITLPTTLLGKELKKRFSAAEVNGCFLYRGILSNPDGEFPDENPCIHAERYDAIASRGWNAYQLLCGHCEVRGLCEERGYRSQAKRAKEAQVTVMPFPDIFLNPSFRSLAKEFLPTFHDDLIMHDEFDPANAFLQIDVPKLRLVQMRDDWKGYDPSQFAKELLCILEVEGDLSLLRTLIMKLTDAEREAILEGLTCVLWNGQILSREDAHRCDDFRAKIQNTEQILTLPRLETDGWNLLVQLELFFERYPRDADMPMFYPDGTLTFYLPPMPMKTRARMGFMSATLNETFFRRVMDNREKKRGDVGFHDTGLTEWHPEAKVYQLRTNRNPRATAYTPKGERVDGELLSATGEFYWQLVADDLKNENRGLITYKALLGASSFGEGVTTANFGGLVGLDTHFEGVEVLHILFSPELPLTEVEFKAKMLFGDDTEPLSFDRDADGHYIDTRLQACYSDGVISELQQAIGRGRLVSKPVTVVIWCSHYLPGITDRKQTTLFDELDWHEADGDIEKLGAVVATREEAEQNGDVQAYAEATGQSERTARRQTEDARQQSKSDRNAEIVSRYAGGAGETQQEIADALGIGCSNR